jgi:ketosteroid isomerase-like protein
MPLSNLDLVRSIYAAWEHGDFSSAEWAHPEIEYVLADGPSPRTWTGLTGLAEGFRDYVDAWERYGYQADEYRELDGEHILVLARHSGRGKTSGLDLAQLGAKGAMLFRVGGGVVTRIVVYNDRSALADLGLTPEGGSPDS